MASAGSNIDEMIMCPGIGHGEAIERLLAAVAAEGSYKSVQVTAEQFHFARTYRPTWAIAAGVATIWLALLGLLFFFVTTTETSVVSVESDHTGTRVRITGRMTSSLLGRIRSSMSSQEVSPQYNQSSVGQPVVSAYQVAPPTPVSAAASPPDLAPMPISAGPPRTSFVPTPLASPPGPGVPGMPQLPHPPAPTGNTPPEHATPPPLPPAAGTPATPAPASPPPPAPATVLPPPPAPVGDVLPPPPVPATDGLPPAPGAAPGQPVRIPLAPSLPLAHGHSDERTVVVHSFALPSQSVRLDDGTVLDATSRIVLGRDPDGPGAVAVHDVQRSVSKTHVAIEVVDGEWTVTDMHSTNGVVIVDPVGGEHQTVPGSPVVAPAGSTVHFGERRLTLGTLSIPQGTS